MGFSYDARLFAIHFSVMITGDMGSLEIGGMDRDEAIKLLRGRRSGIAVWNERRRQGERAPRLNAAQLFKAYLAFADLSDADLRETNLAGARLQDANLAGANLSGANLCGAILHRAKLLGANLSGVNLCRADLTYADLYAAQLPAADLSKVDFSRARLYSANLADADLSKAICRNTEFVNVDLSNVTGLDSVFHYGPSSIGIDTLYRSKGKIPEVFLRGCGVSDELICYLPSLIGSMSPIQFHSCFISHSTKDRAFADRLHSRMLQEKLRVWYAPKDMRGGRKSIEQIDQAIHFHDKLLLVFSAHSMASDWVMHEITRAIEREKKEKRHVLFPIGLSPWKQIKAWTAFDPDPGKDVAKVVREYHLPDFSNWIDHERFEAAFTRLLAELKPEKSAGPVAPTPRPRRPKTPD
jgi:TIR domain/Pentapeptide repeats (8 copies)